MGHDGQLVYQSPNNQCCAVLFFVCFFEHDGHFNYFNIFGKTILISFFKASLLHVHSDGRLLQFYF